MFVTFANGKTWPVEDNYVTAVVEMSLGDIIDHDLDGFLDGIADMAIGDIRMMNITYEAIGGAEDGVRLRVTGDVSEIIDDPDRENISVIDAPDEIFTALGQQYGWSAAETAQAKSCATVSYRDECQIPLANGRELRCPAFPRECDYVRVVEDGHDLMYWSVDEWRDDPSDVMGAILGLAHGATESPISAAP